jgi:hypothetical protein
METSSSPLLPQPEQQQQGETTLSNPEAVASSSSGSAWHSSGSIGPCFAVISVLAVLAVLSCVLGRMWTRGRGAVTPLESMGDRGCFRWVKRKCRQCTVGAVEGGVKMMAFGKKRDNGDQVQHPTQV